MYSNIPSTPQAIACFTTVVLICATFILLTIAALDIIELHYLRIAITMQIQATLHHWQSQINRAITAAAHNIHRTILRPIIHAYSHINLKSLPMWVWTKISDLKKIPLWVWKACTTSPAPVSRIFRHTHLPLMLLLLTLQSCQSHRHITTTSTENTETIETRTQTSRTDSHLGAQADTQTTDSMLIAYTQGISRWHNITITRFSAPDSLGHQHITEQITIADSTRTNTSTITQAATRVETHLQSTKDTQYHTHTTDTITSRTQSRTNAEQNTDKTAVLAPISRSHLFVALLLLCFVLILVRWLRRHF